MQMDLIYHRAHHYSQLWKECFEDLVQEGVIGNLEAELSFDPMGNPNTRLSTWIWWSIDRRMRVYCERGARTPHFTGDPPDLPDGTDIIAFIEFMDSLPEDVYCVCETVLSNPNRFVGITSFECWRLIKEELRERLGWSFDKAHEAIQDTKYWFNNTSPAMCRLIPAVRGSYESI